MGERLETTGTEDLFVEGYERALQLLGACATTAGFLASIDDTANYKRVWARDGVIMGLAGLLTGRDDLVVAMRRTLETLADRQGPHGEIPANVDVATGRVSYGGITGRLDSDLWFVIGIAQTWRRTGDDAFLTRMLQPLARVRFLLGCWEYNNRDLLYVPVTGDWADEYLHNGYVLYDQLLYLQVLRELRRIHAHVHGTDDHDLIAKANRLERLIAANYWMPADGEAVPADVYHEVIYAKGRSMAAHRRGRYWMPFFTPAGYGYRFDAFANVLVSLFDVATDAQRRTVDETMANVTDDSWVLPAFHPVITPQDEDWEDLQITFSYSFKNKPYEFQNGGRWPMITGFHVVDLARRGRVDLARQYLEGIHRANSRPRHGKPWGFPEFLHGKTHAPGGTANQGWSAAAAILGHHALRGETFLL